MSAGGYIFLLHRPLWDHSAFRNFEEAAAFAWMISMAAWRPSRVQYKGRALHIDRGQSAISTRDFARECEWSEARVRRYLARLQDEAMIARAHAGVSHALANRVSHQEEGRLGLLPCRPVMLVSSPVKNEESDDVCSTT